MKLKFIKYKNKIKQVREVEVTTLIDLLKLNNTNNQVQDYLNQKEVKNNGKNN